MAAPHIPLSPTGDVDADKRALRERHRTLRSALSGAALAGLEHQVETGIAELMGDLSRHSSGAPIIAGFLPLGSEPDLLGLLTRLHNAGATILLPETPRTATSLGFRRWSPSAALQAGRFGTLVPDGDLAIPDLMLVPLLAFDAGCHRLGYGGGFYDRTLAELPHARTVGIASEVLRVDKVPVGPHDVPLDRVATEARLWR